MGKVSQQITIEQPVDKVWQSVRDFYDISWTQGIAQKIQTESTIPGTEVGARRVINEVFVETLILLDDKAHTFAYELENGPGSLKADRTSNYIGRVQLDETAQGTHVEWSATFESEDEAAVIAFCEPMFRALLNALDDSLKNQTQ